jgi:hypothetical protein
LLVVVPLFVVVAAATVLVETGALMGLVVDEGYWLARPHQTFTWVA